MGIVAAVDIEATVGIVAAVGIASAAADLTKDHLIALFL